jgi:hypothetical protein
MSSAYADLMKLACRVLTPAEISRLKLAIDKGARGLATGKYDISAVENAAEKIAQILKGSHRRAVEEIEENEGINFIDTMKNLITDSVVEMASKTVSPSVWMSSIFGESERKESRSTGELELF